MADYEIRKLGLDDAITEFDCGDDYLNDFIINDAPLYRRALLAMTYVLENKDSGKIVAYFSVANDRISIKDFPTSTDFNCFRKHKFVNEKRLRSYPAIKICRLGIDKTIQGQQIGTFLIDFVGTMFVTDNKSGCRFLTVDAYSQAIPFYLKNDFAFLSSEDDGQRTRLMYFDLSDIDG
ncbi:GNAT family N-acetyltransferase [uncultured Muribaculum sp.]|uniref:GNAT family N-acetyltransferase n=1 Tax=uncultured Muribaculum sp. TaxID=1918613 RepID=UPI0034441845